MEQLHVFPKCPDLQEQLRQQALEEYRSLFVEHSDNLMKYTIYETVEEVLKNYNLYDYMQLFKTASTEPGGVYKRKNDEIELPKILLEYSNEKLKQLFTNEDVLICTKFAIDRTKNGYHVGQILHKNSPKYDKLYGKYYNERLGINIMNEEYRKNLEWKKNCEYDGIEKDIEIIENAIKATDIIYNLLKNPNENDDVFNFIINWVCRASRKDLLEIIRKYNISFNNKKGRPSNNLKVCKFDKNGNLLAIYENRKECMEKEGIGKAILSMVISGKKLSYKKAIFKELTEEKFKEIQETDNF